MTPDEKLLVIRSWTYECYERRNYPNNVYFALQTIYDTQPTRASMPFEDRSDAIDDAYRMVSDGIAKYLHVDGSTSLEN